MKKEKWQIVENVVHAIEAVENAGLSDLKVVPKAMVPKRNNPSRRREVDVLISFRAGSREMRVALDVKNEKRPLDVTKVEQLAKKSEAIDVDRYIVVSTSGYVAEAKEDYGKIINLLTLEEVKTLRWSTVTYVRTILPLLHFFEIHFGYDEEELSQMPNMSLKDLTVQGLGDGSLEASLEQYLVKYLERANPQLENVEDGFGHV